jgi:hypothetical protein
VPCQRTAFQLQGESHVCDVWDAGTGEGSEDERGVEAEKTGTSFARAFEKVVGTGARSSSGRDPILAVRIPGDLHVIYLCVKFRGSVRVLVAL